MFKKWSVAVLALAGLLFWRCASDPVSPPPAPPRDLTTAEQKLVGSGHSFGLKLFRQTLAAEEEKNVFISPLSVSMALGMTYNGADGETKQGMEETLGLSGLTIDEVNQSYKSLIELLSGLDPSVQFQLANSIWYRNELTVKQPFIDLNRTYFSAEVDALDFTSPASVTTINNWVSDNTNGKIEKIVEELNSEDMMFLINAIYFKGNWTTQFDKADTRDDWFYTKSDNKVPCRMMTRDDVVRGYFHSSFVAVDLPYGNGLYSMTLFLPKPDVDFNSFLALLTVENWDQWMAGFTEIEAPLMLPKFKVEYEIKLNDVLSALGMERAFTDDAEFPHISPFPLKIDQVLHKTFVKVDEEGTEAAAATSVDMGPTSLPPSFIFNRPFIFAIRESHSGTLLFMGRIVEPEWE